MHNTDLDELSTDSARIRVGVLAISGSVNLLDDVGPSAWKRMGGEAIEHALPPGEFVLLRMLVMPGGDTEEIAQILRDWCDAPNPAYRCGLILTIGGDGNSEQDVVPEATQEVVEQEALDVVETLWQTCLAQAGSKDMSQMESRAVAGVRKQTLIVNISRCFDNPADAVVALLPMLPRAFDELGR